MNRTNKKLAMAAFATLLVPSLAWAGEYDNYFFKILDGLQEKIGLSDLKILLIKNIWRSPDAVLWAFIGLIGLSFYKNKGGALKFLKSAIQAVAKVAAKDEAIASVQNPAPQLTPTVTLPHRTKCNACGLMAVAGEYCTQCGKKQTATNIAAVAPATAVAPQPAPNQAPAPPAPATSPQATPPPKKRWHNL